MLMRSVHGSESPDQFASRVLGASLAVVDEVEVAVLGVTSLGVTWAVP